MRFLIVLCCLLLAACSSAPPPAKGPLVFPPKITQFYASPSVVPQGESTLLCYGVESVASVTLDPGNESLSPALTKCLEKSPKENTTYTLTAKGKDGTTLTQQVTVTTGVAKLKFLDLNINAPQVKAGQPVHFCFQAQGATQVSGGPGKFQKGGNPSRDCLMDNPRKTTTYTIKITGEGRQSDTESMTVKVLP